MKQEMTAEEIHNHYDCEWILVGNPRTDEFHQVQSGEVLFHSKDRDEVYRKAAELRLARFAFLYTGPVIPKGAAAAL